MPTLIPADLTTQLAAVNVLLASVSQSPVAVVDPALSVDVAGAVNTLDEVDRSLQSKGWHWNREDSLELPPNGVGEIVLPENYLWVANAYGLSSSSPMRVSERGRRLYNRDTHSFEFTEPVVLDLVLKLPWEDIPDYARQYITLAAAQLFQARWQGTAIIERVTEKAVEGAMSLVEQREDEASENNSIGGNQYVQSVLGNRGVRRRY